MGAASGGRFEDKLRAIGWLIDYRGLRLLALAQAGEAALVAAAAPGRATEEVVLGPGELTLLRRAARACRGRMARPPGAGCQGLLRALGRELDGQGARACEVRAYDAGLVARVLTGEGAAAAWRTVALSRAELGRRADRARQAAAQPPSAR